MSASFCPASSESACDDREASGGRGTIASSPGGCLSEGVRCLARDKRRDLSWVVRICFALVFAVNVQCALSYVLDPLSYVGGFELEGVAGEAAVRGMGVTFLMWNATYPAFILFPSRFRCLGWVIIAQQVIGLAGESAILAGIGASHVLLRASIERFIAFDAAGLLIMAASFLLFVRVGKLRSS